MVHGPRRAAAVRAIVPHRGCQADVELQAADEDLDATADLVTDRAHGGDPEPGRVVELPVLVALAGEDRAGVTAAHRDDDIGGADDLVGPWLRVLAGDVDADFGHRVDGRRVDLGSRFGTAGVHQDAVAGEVLQPAGGHLGAAGVVDAEEQDGGGGHVDLSFDLGEGLEAVAGEAFGEDRGEGGDASLWEELVEAVGEEPFDGLGSEDASELVLQLGADGEQQVALGEGELVDGGHQPPALGSASGRGSGSGRRRSLRRAAA